MTHLTSKEFLRLKIPSFTRPDLTRFKKPRKPRTPNLLEDSLAAMLVAEGLHADMRREYRFCRDVIPTGKWIKARLKAAGLKDWRFDFAFPSRKVAIEVEGGVWTSGRHTRPIGFNEDCVKYNRAQLMGWVVLRFTETHLKNGEAIKMIREALG